MSEPAAADVAPLRPVPFTELRLLEEGRRWRVDQAIDGLESLTPVRGWVHAQHHGEALEVEGEAETIVTLCCDRCLQPFNHPLRAEARELLEFREALAPSAAAEPTDPLDDRLDPRGRLDPERWLFEQLSLRLPLVNRCGDHCPGPPSWGDAPEGLDPRWAALRNLRSS
ncbi:MAG: DUF177 domain-containing protein [Synechococcaceae cyanobacterium]|nr:DUF177 domain-containing protein [Synechococcaceae cyanobacterium]